MYQTGTACGRPSGRVVLNQMERKACSQWSILLQGINPRTRNSSMRLSTFPHLWPRLGIRDLYFMQGAMLQEFKGKPGPVLWQAWFRVPGLRSEMQPSKAKDDRLPQASSRG